MITTKVSVTTIIDSSPERVWDFYTGPEHMTKWNFASDEWHCPEAQNDLRVGGKLKSRMEAKDGSFGFDFEGIYDEVSELKKIAYSLGDGRKVITVFENIDGKTKITTTFDAENTHPLEMQRDGWQAILENFRRYTEAGNK